MILSDTRVKELLTGKRITIQPNPKESDWQAMTLDGHLANEVYKIKWKSEGGARITIDLKDYKTKEFAKQFWETVEPTDGDGIPIHPGDFFLAYTEEKLALPLDSKVCALVEGKSSLARIGLGIHLAPIIHVGFGTDQQGPQPVMLEIYNHSKNIILLRPGFSICQFIFQTVDGDFETRGINNLGGSQPTLKKVPGG